jgi:hypothetical protein
MRNVRLTMLEGNIPLSCSKCIGEEDQGVISKRLWETYTWMHYGIDIEELVKEMVAADTELFKRDKYLLEGGHKVLNFHE